MKKFKSVWPVLIITVLVITLMLGSFSNLVSAYDAQEYTSAAFFSGKMEKRVKLTEDFNVPDAIDADVEVTVKAPDRKIVADNKDGEIGSVTAMQLGNYIITYTKGKNVYSYNVYCYQEKEYFINVKATDNDFIPGYRRAVNSDKGNEDDGIIRLPYFELAYKNEKGDIITVDDADYRIAFEPSIAAKLENRPGVTGAVKPNEGKEQLVDLAEGLLKINLEARIGTGTEKWYTQEYTVNVQKNFVNEGKPTISVTNFSPNGNINTLYTLPVATAKDSFDNNVFVNVTVTAPDGQPVKRYYADDNGYADTEKDGKDKGEAIVFDNKNEKSFYLTQEGDYKVTYQAVNGSGTTSTTPQTFSIKDVSDKLVPVIKNIEETQLPNKWGVEKVSKGKKSGDKYVAEARPEGKEFTMPFPEVVDNYSKEDDMTLTITLVNPSNRTIGNWSGKVSEYAGDGVAVTESYREYFKAEYQPTDNKQLYFKNTGMAFSFDWIDFTNSRLNKDSEMLGDWTLTYSLRDEANNGGSGNARKAYTITIQKEFADLTPPSVSQEKFTADIPKYVMVSEGGETFRIPSVTVSDDNATSRINTEYYIETEMDSIPTADITIDGEDYEMVKKHDVKGGEEYKIHEHTDGKYYVLITENNKNYAMPLSDDEISKINIFYVAIDNVGNRSDELTGTFEILYAGNVNAGYELDADFSRVEAALTSLSASDFEAGRKDDNTKQLIPVKLGGFDISGIDMSDAQDPIAGVGFPDREYTGFELTILDEKDNSQEITSYAYTHRIPKNDPDDESEVQMYELHVRNIEFIPSYGGEYRLNIRIFDISGKSQAYGFPFFIEGAKDGSGIQKNAAKIGSTGETNVAYELENEYVITPADKYADNGVIVRFIKGRSYTLVGNEFTALDMGTYRITDYTYNHTEISDLANGFEVDFSDMLDASSGHHQKTYKPFAAANNTDKPVIEILGVIPNYHVKMDSTDGVKYEEGKYIILPAITAYTKYGNANIEVKVSFSGSDVGAKELYTYIKDGATVLTFDETRTEDVTTGEGDEAVTEEVTFDNEATGKWAFPTAKDGIYSITVTATMPKSNVDAASKSFEMRVGKTSLPALSISESNRQIQAKVGDKFRMGRPVFADSDWESVSIKLMDPNGAEVSAASSKVTLVPNSLSSRKDEDWTTEYEFEKVGNYEVVITAKNAEGLEKTERYTISVTDTKKPIGPSMTILTVVLIIIGILLIIGVIIYVIRFKPVKKERK